MKNVRNLRRKFPKQIYEWELADIREISSSREMCTYDSCIE